MPRLILGPILGYEAPGRYSICVVIDKDQNPADLQLGSSHGTVLDVVSAALPSGRLFCRFTLTLSQNPPETITYTVNLCGKELTTSTFAVPASGAEPKLAFASCNGFSTDADRLQNQEDNEQHPDQWGQWDELVADHKTDPIHLLILGGDQIYTDAILSGGGGTMDFGDWLDLSHRKRMRKAFTKTMRRQLETFFETQYLRQWAYQPVAEAMASIPSVMMWDDHDIIDGWGSYEYLGESEVMQGLFQIAQNMFNLFQLRMRDQNQSLINATSEHATWGLQIGTYLALGLDNRTHRTTKQIMNSCQWNDVDRWLDDEVTSGSAPGIENLLIVSPVPVVYRRFGGAELMFSASEWIRKEDNPDSLEDDVRDHWQHPDHQQERIRLIMTLLLALEKNAENTKRPALRAIILSGDVHIACTGRITSQDGPTIYQVTSSGILHPPPKWGAWQGIKMTSSVETEEFENGAVHTQMDTPLGSRAMFIRDRNYARIQVSGFIPKIFVEWICESGAKPSIAIP